MCAKKNEERISVVEASRRSGLSLNYVYSLLRSARVEAEKVDGRWLIDPKSLGDRQGTGIRGAAQQLEQ